MSASVVLGYSCGAVSPSAQGRNPSVNPIRQRTGFEPALSPRGDHRSASLGFPTADTENPSPVTVVISSHKDLAEQRSRRNIRKARQAANNLESYRRAWIELHQVSDELAHEFDPHRAPLSSATLRPIQTDAVYPQIVAGREIPVTIFPYPRPRRLDERLGIRAGCPEPRSGRIARHDFEADGRQLLIDTGARPNTVLQNARELLTGPVPRPFPERNWSRSGQVRTPAGLVEDTVPDDQSVIIETTKGLVIITGCGHAGIVNIVTDANSHFKGQPVIAPLIAIIVPLMTRTTVTLDADGEQPLNEAMQAHRLSDPFVVAARPMGLRVAVDAGRLYQMSDELEAEAHLDLSARLSRS
jgi:hypothetical protein